MKELIEAMRAGWQQYAEGGMYIGVFFVALLFLWLVCYNKFSLNGYKEKKVLFDYTLIITILILFPVSTFVLLKYQTTFFTYSQLFLMIPIAPVMAWGLTEFFMWLREYLLARKETPGFIKRKPWICEVAMVAVLAAVLWMAGTLSFANEATDAASNGEKMPEEVLQVLQVLQSDEDIDLSTDVILATDEILEYARAYSGDMKLLYGRDMWQEELKAYTYDVYPEELVELHEWLNTTVHGMVWIDANITVDKAFEILENCECTVLVLTKGQVEEEELKRALENSSFVQVAEAQDYVILKR